MVPRPVKGKVLFLSIVLGLLVPFPCEEGRALWVVRFRLTSPELIQQVTSEAKRAGFNALFVQVYGRGDAYWRSTFVPRSEALEGSPADFDPLGEVLRLARGLGLGVHAWLNVYYVWPYPPPLPKAPEHIVNRHPEWLIQDEEGRTLLDYSPAERRREPIEGLFLDPSNPSVMDYFLRVVKEVTEGYPVDGVHLDFIRYPGPQWGYNPRAVEDFKRRWTVDPRLLDPRTRRPDPSLLLREDIPFCLLWSYYYQSLWAEHRSRYVTRLVEAVSRFLRRRHPEMVLSAAVLPDPHRAYFERGQDWGSWLERGLLDVAVPMAYTGDLCRVKAQMEAAIDRSLHGTVFAGLGAWHKPPEVIVEEVRSLRRMGVKGFSYFSWQGMKEQRPDYLSQIASALHSKGARWPKAIHNELSSSAPKGFMALLKKQTFSSREFERLQRPLERRIRSLKPILQAITERLYPKALPRDGDTVEIPPRVEFEAIFRYIHPEDCPCTRREALTLLKEARKRIEQGEDFLRLAKQMGGLRTGQLFLLRGADLAVVLWGLKDGQLSPVLELPDGYALFRVTDHHPPERRPFGELPWSLKRVVFLERLSSLVVTYLTPK